MANRYMKRCWRGSWVGQSVEHSTLDFSSGRDLTVREFKPRIRLCADSSDPGACLGFCVSLSLSAPPHTCAQSLSLSLSKKNKHKKKSSSWKKRGEKAKSHIGEEPREITDTTWDLRYDPWTKRRCGKHSREKGIVKKKNWCNLNKICNV